MKVSTLACDYCTAVVAAVTTVRLVTGEPRKGDPELDLCARHLAALGRVFKRTVRGKAGAAWGKVRLDPVPAMAAVEEKRAADRRRYKEKVPADPRKGREVADWVAREAVILSLLPVTGQMHTNALRRQVEALPPAQRLSRASVHKVIHRLRARGLVKQYGSRTHTKYERVNGDGRG